MSLPPAYLFQKLTKPLPTKDGVVLRTIGEAANYVLALPPERADAVAFGNEVILDLAHRAAKQYTGWTMEITQGERALGSLAFKANAGRKR
jgi:hypothetical protein